MHSYPAGRMSLNLEDAAIFGEPNEIRVNKGFSSPWLSAVMNGHHFVGSLLKSICFASASIS
jgi:hypothetical protein